MTILTITAIAVYILIFLLGFVVLITGNKGTHVLPIRTTKHNATSTEVSYKLVDEFMVKENKAA
ncbi:MAG: hypothetical protein ACRBBN_04475 [Methyloligellaceae bacterium]